MRSLSPILRFWPLSAALISLAMLATAHAFQTFGGLAPCHLCLKQREVYWTALGVGTMGALMPMRPQGRFWINAVLTLVFAYGLYLAVYHAGAEWRFWPGPTTCSSGGQAATADSIAAMMGGAKLKPPACDVAAWRMLGLSMAGWNVLASLALIAGSALAAVQEKRR